MIVAIIWFHCFVSPLSAASPEADRLIVNTPGSIESTPGILYSYSPEAPGGLRVLKLATAYEFRARDPEDPLINPQSDEPLSSVYSHPKATQPSIPLKPRNSYSLPTPIKWGVPLCIAALVVYRYRDKIKQWVLPSSK